MKLFIKLLSLFMVALVLQQCNEKDQNLSPGKVKFKFDPSHAPGIGGKVADDFPTGSYLLVSVDVGGTDISYNDLKLQLLKSGDHFISESLTLAPGAYALTEFLVVSPDHEVLYAAPKFGSELAHLVETPLPIFFNVASDEISNLPVEVLNVQEATPEDFGYISFNVEVVSKGSFQLSVFIPEEGELKLTSAEAIIMKDDDTLEIHPVDPKVNVITYDGRSDEEFTLVVIKDGYARYATNFTADSLAEANEGKPLTVVLKPAITFVATVGPNHILTFGAFGPEPFSRLETDLGDGSHTSNSLDEDAQFIEAIYDKSGKYFISNTGDIDKVTGFLILFSPMERLDLRHAPELQYIEDNHSMGPATINLTYNKKIGTINLMGAANLEELKINPDNDQIKYLNITGPNELSSEAMDQIIYNLYHSVVDSDENDRTNGKFLFSASDDQPDVMVGPPSEVSLEMLQDLRDNYGWTITPDPM